MQTHLDFVGIGEQRFGSGVVIDDQVVVGFLNILVQRSRQVEEEAKAVQHAQSIASTVRSVFPLQNIFKQPISFSFGLCQRKNYIADVVKNQVTNIFYK